MRLDWRGLFEFAGDSCFLAGKLAKSQSDRNIANTKPVTESGQIARFGIIERNPKQLGQ
jgi:hypothetical protein